MLSNKNNKYNVPFYGQCTGVEPHPLVKRNLLEQSFTAQMTLLMATSTFRLGTRCYSSPHSVTCIVSVPKRNQNCAFSHNKTSYEGHNN